MPQRWGRKEPSGEGNSRPCQWHGQSDRRCLRDKGRAGAPETCAHGGRLDARHNGRAMLTEPAHLSDEDLLDRAHQLRLLALRGHRDARGPAHEHEREVRRRFSGATTVGATMEPPPRRRPLWKFW